MHAFDILRFFQVENYKSRLSILDSMDQKVIVLEEFNREIRDYESGLQVC